MYTQLEIESLLEGKLQIAYLNQPETFNSLNKILLKELRTFVHEASKNPEVRCIAISGRGKAFCSGQNLKEALSLGNAEDDRIIQRIVIDYYNPLVKEIAHAKKPVVSLVNGAAVGAGAMLALICDISLATESSYFSQAFVNIGLIPDTGGTYWLPKLLGRQQANYLAFTGKKLSATEAKNMGLIADVFPDENFMESAMEVLTTLSNLPTKAIALTKKAFNESYENSLSEQLDIEGILQQEAAETEDFREGVTAFLEKRKPNYKGK
ncbi:enoyl-CoA hydratase/isomerase family protein [Chryseobacterium manosquense]|uniref:Enoyl-CoA hydratase/isomerase family protein n=1 Tax=Chryseobacterium manosquense TaxID=2754694 RepID=A0A7H1DTY5_9FLAO|nr:enoyl-CoA hydratase-related protein [Chryseobacterium manosquense]QNS40443.1 enoyl-CoA hydratase/isomerase family protein [Chryseobacterium manosquense]